MDCTPDQLRAAREVIDLVTDGVPLAKAVKQCGIGIRTFHNAVSSVREVSVDYARAREIRADVLVDEAIAAADDLELDPQRARNMMTIRQWAASKHNSRVYGERIDLNVSQSISIADVRAEAMARVLPMRYQADTLDSDVLDVPAISMGNAPDTISDEPHDEATEGGSSAAGPDIFD